MDLKEEEGEETVKVPKSRNKIGAKTQSVNVVDHMKYRPPPPNESQATLAIALSQISELSKARAR